MISLFKAELEFFPDSDIIEMYKTYRVYNGRRPIIICALRGKVSTKKTLILGSGGLDNMLLIKTYFVTK